MKYVAATRCLITDDNELIYLPYMLGEFLELLIKTKPILTYDEISKKIYNENYEGLLSYNVLVLKQRLLKKVHLNIRNIKKARVYFGG